MTSASDLRVGGYSGLLFVALSCVIIFAAPFWPPLGAAEADVAQWYVAHRTPFLVGNFLAVAAVVPSLAQLAVLVSMLRRADDNGWLWIAVLGAGLIAHAMGAGVLTVYQAVPFIADSPASARALSDLAGAGFALFLLPLGGFLTFACWAIHRTAVLPRWLAYVGAPLALVIFVGSAGAIVNEGPIAGGGVVTAWSVTVFFGWCLLLSIVLIRQAMQSNVR